MFISNVVSVSITIQLLLGLVIGEDLVNEVVENVTDGKILPRRPIVKGSFTRDEKIALVKMHNSLRSSVLPTAKNMKYMTWHDNLTQMAQTWADGCQFVHGQPAVTNPPYPAIGQNLFAFTGSYNATQAVVHWFNENVYFVYSNNTCLAPQGKYCGHYTQVIWANTDRIGCGIRFCATLGGVNMNNAYFVVCNYGPGGNYRGQLPYLSGTPCSDCPSTCSGGNLCKSTSQCPPPPSVLRCTRDAETCVC